MKAWIDFPLEEGQRLQAQFEAPLRVLRATRLSEVPRVLAAAESSARLGYWVVGCVSYEAAPAFDPALRVLSAGPGALLACFAVYEKPVDAAATEDPANSQEVASDDIFCKSWQASWDEANAAQRIDLIRGGIAAGDYYQINLTMQMGSAFEGSAEALYGRLKSSQPGAYSALLDLGIGQILSVSPELFFQRRGLQITTRPMKGTAPRHADPEADENAARTLQQSVKERAENLMIVDLLRNDLARVAETGSVQVESLFDVEAWPSVWQMTSTISAQVRDEVGLPELFGALFPCGSVTGAPKVAAMAAIEALEDLPRGIYCGAIGVLQPGGDAVFSVAIRTVTVSQGVATCGIGSAITIDSTPEGEYAEWMAKRRFLLRATAHFELLETMRLDNEGYGRLEAHIRRMMNSAAWFGFALDEGVLRQTMRAFADQQVFGAASAPRAPLRVRVRANRDGKLACEAYPLEPNPAEVRVRIARQPITGDLEFISHKTTHRDAYRSFAETPEDVFDTLLFNARDELTEFTRGNFFWQEAPDGMLFTPPENCGLLPGVLRAELLSSGKVMERILNREDLGSATHLWFGNSMRGLISARLVQA